MSTECRTCGQRIEMMAFRGTGYCCGLCRKAGEAKAASEVAEKKQDKPAKARRR